MNEQVQHYLFVLFASFTTGQIVLNIIVGITLLKMRYDTVMLRKTAQQRYADRQELEKLVDSLVGERQVMLSFILSRGYTVEFKPSEEGTSSVVDRVIDSRLASGESTSDEIN